MSDGRKVVLRYPEAIRPWMYVLDSLFGYLMLIERLHSGQEEFAGPWNFGPDTEGDITVSRFVELFAQSWGRQQPWEQAPGQHPSEAVQLRLDSTKARRQLRWEPACSQIEAIRETANWYHAFESQTADAATLCANAIERHLAAADKQNTRIN